MADTTAAAAKPSSSVKLVLLGEAAVGKSSLVLRFVNNIFQENKEPTIGGMYPLPGKEPSTEVLSPARTPASAVATRQTFTNAILTQFSLAAFLTQKCNLPHRTIKFEIWDTAGQERFASLAPMYYRNAQSALVVYDITKPTSLVKARHWVAELQRQASPAIVIALVGNKLDLSSSTDGEASASSTDNVANTTSGTDGDGEGDAPAAAEPDDTAADGDPRKVSTKEGREYAEEEGLLFFETSAKSGHNVQDVFTAIANAIPETQMKNTRGPGAAGVAQSALGT
ncbi:MAG: hypothetical protein Q9196_006547, partial [Gyalolechia fulgens]